MTFKSKYKIPKCVIIHRDQKGTVKFLDVFEGFEKVAAVKKVFGKNTRKVLSNLIIRIRPGVKGYLWIDDKKARVMIISNYLRKGDTTHLYLDAVHELVHIKQLHDGKKLFHFKLKYVDWPTEIESYKLTVKEAKRIGMKKNAIREYLKVFWVNKEDMERLYKVTGT